MINFFSDIKICKGFLCSTIIDLSKKCFYQLSNELLENILNQSEKVDEDILSFLSENELVNNFEQHIELFIPINLSYDKFELKKIDTVFIEFLPSHFKWFNLTFFQQLEENINLIINLEKGIEDPDLSKLLDVCNEFVSQLPIDSIQIITAKNMTEFHLDKNDSRVIVSESKEFPLLKTELNLYVESLHRHTYFNKNIFINSNEEIKNAFESEKSYGTISELKDFSGILDIVKDVNFQKYWRVNKGKCDVCKDCEFQNICIDDRLPYQRKDGSWYHKKECVYNPYISKWEKEEGYLSLEEVGIFSGHNGYKRDNGKIASINDALWGE
ncbi:MAG: hypothetical protein COB15_07665 [Flavobacteriales bacterium]|nr:MAG: hypothetical protein COB15_07665 [Flavobacteriales bacterium]